MTRTEATGSLHRVRFRGPVDDRTYPGWTDGSTWNGFANIVASEATAQTIHRRMLADGVSVGEAEIPPVEQRRIDGRTRSVVDFSNGYAFTVVETER